MALTLLNQFVWEIPEAKIPFLIADAVLLVALHYIDRGVKAEKELADHLQHGADVQHQEDKTADKAQKAAQRAAQRVGNKHNGAKQAHNDKKFNIQQPSKRD